jgi:hypothetical protein
MAALQRWTGPSVFLAVVLLFVLFPATRTGDRVERGRTALREIPNRPEQPAVAYFGAAQPSADAKVIADRIATIADNRGSDFVIVDKKDARLYVFDGAAHLRGFSTVLLGRAMGDDMAPDIGKRAFAAIHADEKTTPAGRFLAERGHDNHGQDVIWVDYDAAVAIHRVLTTNIAERRLQRLASGAAADKRISMGCINVPVAFYDHYLHPMFVSRRHLVYILPDTKSIDAVFGVSLLAAQPGAANSARSD